MNLKDELSRGIYTYGFEQPSKIQQLAIVPMSKRNDILAQSQSGTGKTGAFTIGSLSVVDSTIKAPQVLVICPTRELSQQTERVAQAIGSYMGLKVLSATGGNQLRNDIQSLKAGAQFIVGTPGRIFDLICRGELTVDQMKYVILDEADQMLEDLFAEQIKVILNSQFPTTTSLALFSATMPKNVLEIAETYLNNPVRILIPQDEVTLDGIKQYYVQLDREDWKLPVLLDLYQQITVNQALIYVNKRQKAEWLAKQLSSHGFTLEFIHGEMDVAERKKRMDDFRSGMTRVIISTDLLARGIDVQQVSLVINYEMPIQRENYVHRIGRSGRYGKKGNAINLVYGDEMNMVKEIESHYSTIIHELPDDLSVLSVSS
uniref:Helicase n=1 Tax=viral metagenome TaxID=1070528 RepID=A0A6C0KTK7_9ZZZZ